MKEIKFETAKEIAQDWYFELRGKQKEGIPVHGKKFKDVLEEFFEHQNLQVKSGEMKKGNAVDYERRLKGKLGTYFNDYYLQDITLQSLNEFKVHRISKDNVRHTTIKHDIGSITQVLKYCKDQKYITNLPETPKKSKKDDKKPRPYFSLDEWKHLLSVSKERIESGRGIRVKRLREQLHDFILIMVHTGCRVDEVYGMTFGCARIYKKKGGDRELRISVDGKTGVREVRGMIGAVSAYERICKRSPKHKQVDLLFPVRYGDGLNNLLDKADLKKDKYGRVRNAKSFRATYIMYRLMKNVPIKSIALNCGNDSAVIDKYYAKYLTSNMLDDSITDLPE
ncbi:MAG: site-specific integrase [Actinobacteria bacterium]|nr:site-specific integrase [Actinomycetota bacterium]